MGLPMIGGLAKCKSGDSDIPFPAGYDYRHDFGMNAQKPPQVDARAIGWMSFARNVGGFEYFWATDWAASADLRDVPWPEKADRWRLGLSGAGQLCYPGDDGLPIPSLRLINLRDAMEDWAAFRLAGGDLRGARPVEIRDPSQLARVRHEIYAGLAREQQP